MQNKHLISSLPLILSMTAISAWGAEEPAVDEERDASLQPSYIEGWVEEEPDFTFFGMGFESRNPGVAQQDGVPGQSKVGPTTGGSGDGGRK